MDKIIQVEMPILPVEVCKDKNHTENVLTFGECWKCGTSKLFNLA